jgi:hypothetical protein
MLWNNKSLIYVLNWYGFGTFGTELLHALKCNFWNYGTHSTEFGNVVLIQYKIIFYVHNPDLINEVLNMVQKFVYGTSDT